MLNVAKSLIPRVIPCLLLQDSAFVKTQKFKKPKYIGDPVNTINLFNKFEVDEIVLLDIGCVRNNKEPDFQLIEDLASECWVPLSYGGGIRTLSQAKRILNSGIEKIVVDTLIYENPAEVRKCVQEFGSSSVVACVNVAQNIWGGYEIKTRAGTKIVGKKIADTLAMITDLGVGEIIINSITRDGMFTGYDSVLIRAAADAVNVPVVALGGAKEVGDFKVAIDAGASAAAAGSYFVFQNGVESGVLVNFPSRTLLEELFYGQ